MQLTQKQTELILSKARFKVLNWGRRSGKTTVFAYEALGTALTTPNAHITYYAQTFGDARDIAWNIFLSVFGEAVVSKNETLLEIKLQNLKGGTSLVSLKGWESVYQTGKGRGIGNDLILADEVAFCRAFIEYYDKVLAPTLLTTKGRAVFGSTPNGFNDFYTLTQRANSNPEWFYSHATSYDNPANEAGEIERIKREVTEDRFAQEYLADFRKMEGLVYKEFSHERHVFDSEVTKFDEYIAGVDFGYKNPAAVIHIKRDGDDNYFVTNEWYVTERSEEQIVDYVKSCHFNRVYPDPENAGAIGLMNQRGIAVVEVNKGKGSVKNGIDRIHLLFKMGKLRIHKSCVSLIWELENYRYPDKRENHNDDENPIKEHDHALDALRYALATNKNDNVISPEQRARQFLESKRNLQSNAR